MRLWAYTFLIAFGPPGVAAAEPQAARSQGASALCLPAIAAAERSARLPAQLLQSIAYIESGRRDPESGRSVPWPWTINAAGVGHFYASKEEAVVAVRLFQAGGVRSIDVGCAQVNLQHHPHAFESLEGAFDPETNANYAARFLKALFSSTGSWPLAAASYHSSTPWRGYAYARKVLAIWPDASRYGSLPGPGPGPAPAPLGRRAVNYSIYTPKFAAQVQRIDQDLARNLRTGAALR